MLPLAYAFPIHSTPPPAAPDPPRPIGYDPSDEYLTANTRICDRCRLHLAPKPAGFRGHRFLCAPVPRHISTPHSPAVLLPSSGAPPHQSRRRRRRQSPERPRTTPRLHPHGPDRATVHEPSTTPPPASRRSHTRHLGIHPSSTCKIRLHGVAHSRQVGHGLA